MEGILSEMPLAIFTTLGSVSAGAYIGLAIALLCGSYSAAQLKKIDNLVLAPIIVTVISFIAAFFHLAGPQNAYHVLNGAGTSPLSDEILFGIIFTVLALVFTILCLTKKLGVTVRKILSVIVAIAAIVYLIFMGMAYIIETIPSWNTPMTILNIIAYGLVGGAAFATWIIAQGGAVKNFGAAKVILVILMIAGVVLAIIAMAVQLSLVADMNNAFIMGQTLVQSALPYAISGLILIAIGAILGIVAACGKCSKPLALVGTLVIIVGVFLARLAFYLLEMVVGI
ncbi:MAG: dimethyl sulfoxide reductase anchor subunit [Eggerthellaceae bacterium]|nr:dimethyl sulfoxide reductase anchor subunit [Eggerthellaceae bacterium]